MVRPGTSSENRLSLNLLFLLQLPFLFFPSHELVLKSKTNGNKGAAFKEKGFIPGQ